MVRITEYEDPSRLSLVGYLKKQEKINDAPIWGKIASDLARARKNRSQVNLEKINKFTKSDDMVVVAGKILGDGKLDHSVTIASYKFSKSALEKIHAAQGKSISIEELVKLNPKGTNIKILR